MRLTLNRRVDGLKAVVVINRAGKAEILVLAPSSGDSSMLESDSAPAEPHDFNARLTLSADGREKIHEFTWRSRLATLTERLSKTAWPSG